MGWGKLYTIDSRQLRRKCFECTSSENVMTTAKPHWTWLREGRHEEGASTGEPGSCYFRRSACPERGKLTSLPHRLGTRSGTHLLPHF